MWLGYAFPTGDHMEHVLVVDSNTRQTHHVPVHTPSGRWTHRDISGMYQGYIRGKSGASQGYISGSFRCLVEHTMTCWITLEEFTIPDKALWQKAELLRSFFRPWRRSRYELSDFIACHMVLGSFGPHRDISGMYQGYIRGKYGSGVLRTHVERRLTLCMHKMRTST